MTSEASWWPAISSRWCGRSPRPTRRRATPAELRSLAAGAHRLRCWLDAVDAAVVARSAELASVGGRRSSREADVIAERAAVCAAMPEVHAALADGTLSAGHADAIARASNRLDDDERVELAAQAQNLVGQAATTSVDAFARQVRDLARRISRDEGVRHHEKLRSQRTVRRWMDREGMCHTQISLDPEADARLSAAFDAAVPPRRPSPTTPHLRPAPRRRLHGDGHLTTCPGRSPPRRAARAHRPRDRPHRPSRRQRLRDLRRPAPPTRHREALACEPTSSRSCWTATAESSTSAEPNASPSPTNAEHSAPCTKPAPRPTAPSGAGRSLTKVRDRGRRSTTLRRFNRCYTQRIGVLAESYLDTGRPLGPSRLLFEIGADGARVADLRRRLGLDSGYLSRLLRQLEQEDLSP